MEASIGNGQEVIGGGSGHSAGGNVVDSGQSNGNGCGMNRGG